MLFSRLYQLLLIHSLLFPLYAAAFDHHLYERLPASQPFYLQAGQFVYLYQIPDHHKNGQASIFRPMKDLPAFTELESDLSTLPYISNQSLSTMFSSLDLVDARTTQLPREVQVSRLQIFIGPPEKPPASLLTLYSSVEPVSPELPPPGSTIDTLALPSLK
jgi:hypothetical protein